MLRISVSLRDCRVHNRGSGSIVVHVTIGPKHRWKISKVHCEFDMDLLPGGQGEMGF